MVRVAMMVGSFLEKINEESEDKITWAVDCNGVNSVCCGGVVVVVHKFADVILTHELAHWGECEGIAFMETQWQ